MSDQNMSAADILEQFRKLDPDAKQEAPDLVTLFGFCWGTGYESTRSMVAALKRLQPRSDQAVHEVAGGIGGRRYGWVAADDAPARVSAHIARRAGDVIDLLRDLDDTQRKVVFDFAQFALGEEETETELRQAAAEARGRK